MDPSPLKERDAQQTSYRIVLVAVIVGLILVAAGIYYQIWGAGGLALLGTGVTLIVLPLLIHVLVIILLKAEDNINRLHLDAVNLQNTVRQIAPMLKIMSDNSQISDNARSLAHREFERDALRQAIREEMYRSDWEAAHYLIDQMEHRFGYKQEAKILLEELNKVRVMTIEDKINEAVVHIETMMDELKWERARQESERLMKLFPRHERIMDLPAELGRRREVRKQELLAQWKVAVDRNEVDTGITILTELDQYLSRQEAQSLQDSVRNVFKSRLVNLGVQFSLAATEGRWGDALESGLHIRREFPNSRMARELAAKWDILRVRAGFVPETEITQKQADKIELTEQS